MPESLLHTENLSVIYNPGKQNEVRSLEDVTIDIYPEEYVIVYGPSGCGKSTLLYSLAALQAPSKGDVVFSGRAFSQMSKKDKLLYHQEDMGMIFQAFFLIPSLTIIDNICLPKLFRNVDKKERRAEGMELLKRFGITEQAFKYPSELSGGQKQRVAIARALMNKPNIIFADEPVGNLDSESSRNVMAILSELNEVDKKTIVLVTHEPSHLQYGDRILHMKDGRVVQEEIRRDKRMGSRVGTSEAKTIQAKDVSPELEMLIRTFLNMPQEQAAILLIPYKVKQLMFHVFSEITEEQAKITEGFLRDFLFNNIDKKGLEESLDMEIPEGGASWNRRRAATFADRVSDLIGLSVGLKSLSDPEEAARALSRHLVRFFSLELREDEEDRFRSFLGERLQNAIDGATLRILLDKSWNSGGMGLHKFTADRIVREVEMILLLKY